ncbi:PHP domain-containing protein [Haloparvum alkalitolerans]|uniref:PHP domain-containing protein n=1 Tax=Haloparvum alkalitolerans TaxID=1042953 RepID=UPI003CEAD579
MTTRVAADLHLHTTASDGTCSIPDRVEQAVERDLDSIAITDHDRIDDVLTERVELRNGISIVTGVEIRADLFDTKIEILGHFVDPDNEELLDALDQTREFRRERNRQLVSNLTNATELDLSYEALQEEADGTLGRPHLAERLVDGGVVDSIGEAFDAYLGTGAEAYVPMKRLPHGTVLNAIHAAGGVASLAHPGRIRSERVPEMVDTLADSGLDGIEVWYPYDSAGPDAYADIDVAEADELAAEYDLLRVGGSDCHGPGSGKFRIGGTGISREQFELLRETAGLS